MLYLLLTSTNGINWNNQLSKQIQQLQPFQVIILGIENHPKLKILEKTPTWSANFGNIEAKLQVVKQLSTFQNPRQTTLFILTKISQIEEHSSLIRFNLTNLFSIVNRISGVRTKPKCLLLHFSKRAFNYEKLLRKVWSKQFLDFSVLEIIELGTSGFQFIQNRLEIPTLHFWNPFLETYTRKIYSRKTKLFPTKLTNLNGYQIKVGFYDYFPLLNVLISNKEGRGLTVTGLAIQLPETLSKKMNFTMIKDGTYRKEAGRFDYDKRIITGVFDQLMHNEIQLIAVELAIVGPNEMKIFERSTVTGNTDFCAVVPILPAESKTLVVTNDFLRACIFIIFLLIFTWVLSRLLKFNIRFWPMMYIVQLVIGAPLPQEPQKSQERMIFACIFLSSTVYLSWIYIAITITVLETKGEIEFVKLTDLVDHNLTCSFPTEASYILSKSFNPEYPQMFEKYFVSSSENCVDMLLKHENISCIMIKELADYVIQKNRGRQGEPLMKIVDERVINSFRALKLEPETPFVDRFNQIILMLQTAGIHRKWYELVRDGLPNLANRQPEELTGFIGVQYQIFVFPVIGFVLSFCVFIGEIITSRVIEAA